MPRTLLYVAYPMRLDLAAANAIQTYHTVRELQRVLPGTKLVIPRWLGEPSAFAELGALHLPRPAINKLSRLLAWAGWSYFERSVYSFMLLAILVLWRLVGRGYPVLYVRDAVCAAWLAYFAPAHGAQVVYEAHDLEALHPSKASHWPGGFWSRFLPWLDRSALRRSRALVSLTRTFKEWLVERRVKREGQVAVIPDAFDPSLYYPQDTAEARRTLGLPAEAYVVGYAGLTFAYRRLDLLVDAFARLAEDVPEALLAAVGGRPNEVAELREQARRLGLDPARTVMPGQVDQAISAVYMNASDVLVIPDTVTDMTASPLKLFEYMAVGKPLVCKDMPALREIVDEQCALFFEAGRVDELASCLQRLQGEPELAARLGSEARERAARFTYRARAEAIARVVKACL